jgi:phosphatidylglycerol---prolipoprotein diacylglyceryl transferase
MIPYFSLTTIPVGPIDVQVWGLAVSAGIIVALLLGKKVCDRSGLSGEMMYDLALWVLVSALVFARLGYFLFYNVQALVGDPFSIVRIWDGGMSSFGGYLGAAVGAWLFVRRRRIQLRPYAEVAAFVLPLGYGIGRIGCFLIHDHPGILCDCFFSVDFPAGARLDHGLLLSVFGFALFSVFVYLRRRGHVVGQGGWFYMPILLMAYGSGRFVLDFFRAYDLPVSDLRVFGLTPAQYGGVLFIALGLYLARKLTEDTEIMNVTKKQ